MASPAAGNAVGAGRYGLGQGVPDAPTLHAKLDADSRSEAVTKTAQLGLVVL
jgi:hypothetical protein